MAAKRSKSTALSAVSRRQVMMVVSGMLMLPAQHAAGQQGGAVTAHEASRSGGTPYGTYFMGILSVPNPSQFDQTPLLRQSQVKVPEKGPTQDRLEGYVRASEGTFQ